MGQRERRLPQPGTDPFRAGIGAVRPCCHRGSVSDFVDS
jgi:hypothetical protein